MAEFLTSQLDYVYFVYGLALVLLGSVCLSMSRESASRAPWGLVAAFAFTHGVMEWLQLVAIATGDSPAFLLVRTLLLAVAFGFLLEAARRARRSIRERFSGAWIYAIVPAGIAALVVIGGMPSLGSAVRLILVGPATLWAAALLASASFVAVRSREIPGSPRALAWAAAFLAAFGLSAGIVIPAASFLPAAWPTNESFQAATGVPIQLVRGSSAAGLAFAIWAYALSLDRRGRLRRKRSRTFWVVASSMVAVLAAGWFFTERLGRLHEKEMAADAESASARIRDHLLMEMESAEEAARVLAGVVTRSHAGLSRNGSGASRRDDAVDLIAGGQADRVAYLLDPAGLTVAASNRAEPDSFLGKNYSVRSYFKDAMAGYPGRFTGIGLTSRAPGFYASQPIRGGAGEVTGVAVVKRVLEAGSLGPSGTETAFVIAPDGRVILAGSARFAGRPLWAQGVAGSAQATAQDQPPILDHRVSGSDWVLLDGERYIAVQRPIPGSDWSVVTLKKETAQIVNRFLGIAITFLLSIVIVAYFVAVQRQYGAESRLVEKHREAEGRARTMARRADTDALTGVLNRAGFNDAFSREFSRAQRYRQPLSLVLLDLDHFKLVNDRHGHPAGDKVLEGTARLLESRIRESDLVARWGGEEFAVVAPMTDADGAAQLAEKIRGLMEVTNFGPAGAVTASFGVTEMQADDTLEALLSRVDQALYRAKDAGRNQVQCAEPWVVVARATTTDASKQEGSVADLKKLYNDTGFAPIDAEHRVLSDGLEAFIGKVNGGDAGEVRTALAALVAGVAAHFAHEEELMADFSYPNLTRHKEAHDLFVGDAMRFQAGLERNGVTPNFRRWAVGRLLEWFRYHILAHDIGLGQFLTKAGVAVWRGPPPIAPRPGQVARVGN
ncbi:MAG: diguanylate cyclase [Deltaproteobacteria bacterium]|nr:diguanylate cyclase [Deltaproteobacteria bacterium]